MKQEQPIQIRVSHLKKMYMENMGKQIDRAELINSPKYDITEILKFTIISTIVNKALLNIAIRGEVTTGKSSVGAVILKWIIDQLIQMEQIKIKDEKEYNDYLYEHIKSDQTEYLRFTLDNIQQTGVLIDEFSSLGETGLNATTEMAMYNEHSDLFAQRFVHKVSCSPSYIQDKNATIILDIIGKDTENEVTQVLVYYRDVVTRIPMPLGTAIISVSEVIHTEWYARYRKKKFMRMSLLDKHGVRNIKELEFAIITYESFKEIQEAIKIRKFNEGAILSVMEGVRRKHKMVYSLFTLNYLVTNIKALVDLQSEVYKLEEQKEKARSQELEKMAGEALNTFKKLLNDRLNEEQSKIKVLEEYRRIQ